MARQPRILIVDDFPETAQLLARLVTGVGGYETLTATDSFEAIRIAEQFRPQFVFLDIGMPNLDGFETAEHMRKERWGKGIVLIAVSAVWDQQCQLRANEAGFDGYLLKPTSAQAILDLIREFAHGPRRSSVLRKKSRFVHRPRR